MGNSVMGIKTVGKESDRCRYGYRDRGNWSLTVWTVSLLLLCGFHHGPGTGSGLGFVTGEPGDSGEIAREERLAAKAKYEAEILMTSSSSSSVDSNCSCDYENIFERLPYFLQDIGRSGDFDFAFQGTKGERGYDGAEGPRGEEGRSGQKGSKGDTGERGLPGLPGGSHISVRSGAGTGPESDYGSSPGFNFGRGEKGNNGTQGPPGPRGPKGERGEAAGFLIRNGLYTQVKGEQGKRGRRGKPGEAGLNGLPGDRGEPGIPGLSIQGEKGSKGEPAQLPDVEYLRGSPGPRGPPGLAGPPGLPGPPGPGGGGGRQAGKPKEGVRLSIPLKGERGERGEAGTPGVSLQGAKGEPGLSGPPGLTGLPGKIIVEGNAPGAINVFAEEDLPEIVELSPGTLAYVMDTENVFIRGKNGWRQIQLGKTVEDKFLPEDSLSNDVGEKYFFQELRQASASTEHGANGGGDLGPGHDHHDLGSVRRGSNHIEKETWTRREGPRPHHPNRHALDQKPHENQFKFPIIPRS